MVCVLLKHPFYKSSNLKNTTFILFIIFCSFSFYNYSVAQEKSVAPKIEEVLFSNSIYLDAGYGVGGVTGIWSGYTYSALSAKLGNRWKIVGTNYSTYNLGVQLTWVHFSLINGGFGINNSDGYGIGFAGVGISNMFRFKKNSGFEVNINLIPLAQSDLDKYRFYYGPMANLELRFRYKRFYLGLDSGISVLFNKGMIFGAHTGLKLGVNLF